MDLNRRFSNHNKRWNIQINEEKQFVHFKHRLISVIDEFIGDFLARNSNLDHDFNKRLSFHLGKEPVVRVSAPAPTPEVLSKQILSNITMNTLGGGRTERGFGDTAVYRAIKSTENAQQLITILQILFWILEEYDQQSYIQLAKEVQSIVSMTPAVGLRVAIKKKSVILYPLGAQLLDEGVVNDVISWLEDYPDAAEHFEKALEIYQVGDRKRYRELLDSLRLALEYLLRQVLNSDRSIENQIKGDSSVVLRWLNEKGVHQEIVNMYRTLLAYYALYQNDAVKHKEKFSLNDIEFMIYLTGTFMRLLLQLSVER